MNAGDEQAPSAPTTSQSTDDDVVNEMGL